MRFSSLFVTAIAAIYVLASPAPLNNGVHDIASAVTLTGTKETSPLEARATPVPPLAEIKMHMLSEAEVAGKSLFYSGPGGYVSKADAFAKAVGQKILKDFWKDPHYPDIRANDPSVSKQFWDNASTAMAEISSGVIWVLSPGDTTGDVWYTKSVWNYQSLLFIPQA